MSCSEEHRLRLAINAILASRYIGFYRICGKELQAKYRAANLTKNNPNRAALLNEIIEVYYKALDDKQPPMANREKRHKQKLILQFAKKDWRD